MALSITPATGLVFSMPVISVHTYVEAVAEKVYKVVKNDFADALDKLINNTNTTE
jgi:hypothetical protein